MATDTQQQEPVTDPVQKALDKAGNQDIKSSYRPVDFGGADDIEKFAREKVAFKELMGMFSNWESWRKSKEDIWTDIYKFYMCAPTSSKIPTRAKIVLPKVFELIENAMPKLIGFIFSSDNFFDIEPDDKKESNIADNNKKLLSDQLKKAKFSSKYIDFTKQLALYGTSYFFVDWTIKREWRYNVDMKREDVFKNDIFVGKELKVDPHKEYRITQRRPDVRVVDILDVFPEPGVQNVEDAEGIFVRTWMNLKDFKELAQGPYPVYTNTDDIKGGSYYDESRQHRVAQKAEQPANTNKVELLTFYGKFDVDGDGIREEALITIANRTRIVRAIALPWWHQTRPIIKVNFFGVPNEWYGIGLVQPIMSLMEEVTTLRRLKMDNVFQKMNGMWKVLATADVDIHQLISSPNGLVILSDMSAVMPLDTPDITQSSYVDTSDIMQEIDKATVPTALTGQTQDTGAQAVGTTKMIISQGLEKFAAAAKQIEDGGISEILRLFYELNLQFLRDDVIIKTFYGDLFPYPMTPEMLRFGSGITFRMRALSEMLGKQDKINSLLAFIGQLNAVSAKVTVSNDTYESLLKDTGKMMGLNPDDIELAAPAPAGLTPPGNLDINSLLGQPSPVTGVATNQGVEAAPIGPGFTPPAAAAPEGTF